MTSRTKTHIQEISVERIKAETRERRLRAIRSLAARLKVASDGSRYVIRFSRAERVEHYVLIGTFGSLALTGLLQTFSHLALVGWVIQLLGGIDTLRTIHHLAALVLMVQSVYHVGNMLVLWLVRQERGAMWPSVRDFQNLVQVVMFNLGLAKTKPESDRFSVEEKLEYWAMLWGTPVMGVTGLVLWFPIVFTSVLPGEIVPISRAIHSWEAILATLAILTWHSYHTLIKETNLSIFTGTMTEEEMQHAHPLEYRRILAAHEYLQNQGYSDDGRENGPLDLEVGLEEPSITTN